jgi:hypothetical protein
VRKLYIFRENEEDGRVLDALPEPGIDPEEIANPTCPRCGGETLMAYEEDGDYNVLTWYCLTDEDDQAKPDAWYLICQNFKCPYEEQVERVLDPMGAEFFNLQTSHMEFDESTGLIGRNPSRMKALIRYLEALRKRYSYRKLDAFLEEARWRYDDDMERVRKWMQKIPPGRRIDLWLNGDRLKATFVAATDDALLVNLLPEGQMTVIGAESLRGYGPHRFDEPEKPEEPDPLKGDRDRWIMVHGHADWVIVQGYHLRLWSVDRFGQYHVGTWDREAAEALGLEPCGQNCWDGLLRRRQIEARYTKQAMAKVKGYWVEVHGESAVTKSPSVYTEDPAVAAALGLTPVKPWFPEECYDPYQLTLPRFSGVIPREQVEEWDEVCIYQWPIPEAKGSEKEST